MTSPASQKPKVVIVGCGFGGMEAAKALHHGPVDITLVDRTNHHLFQPLLYQVATAGLSAPAIAAPIRHLFRSQSNLTTLLGEVDAIDPLRRSVHMKDGYALAYDHLIVATGSSNSYFGHDDWAANAPGLKTLSDAFEIRRRVLLAFESAEKERDPARQAAWLTFVVIGGGPTGVEMAGTLAEIAHRTLSGEFRHIDPGRARILLVEGNQRLLQAMPDALSESAKRQLEALRVEVHLGSRVTHIDARGLDVQPHEGPAQRIDSGCVIWAAGVGASSLGRQLAEACGLEVDRAGRVQVLPDLSLPRHPEISVIGDLAQAQSHVPGQEPTPVPGVSPAAKQMGRLAAANILRRMKGEPTASFRYRDWGNLATIGRHSAVVDLWTPLGQLQMKGILAWLFWLVAHIYFLIGFRNRMVVLLDWASAYWSSQRYARVVNDIEPAVEISKESPVNQENDIIPRGGQTHAEPPGDREVAAPGEQAPLGAHPSYDEALDTAVDYSFPCSDPIAVSQCCDDAPDSPRLSAQGLTPLAQPVASTPASPAPAPGTKVRTTA